MTLPRNGTRRRGAVLRSVGWILLAMALRTIALDGEGLWCDEAYTAWTAHLPAREHAIAASHDDAPPLYYGIQRLLLPALPASESSVRILSAAAGAAGVAWLAFCPPARAAAGAPAAFLAAGAYGVYYGRQARSYALLMLWGVLLITAVSRFLEGRRRWLALVVLAEALALWTHNVAFALVAGANLAWLVCGRKDPLRWLAAQGIALLLWIPYLARALPHIRVHASANQWIAQYWEQVSLAVAPLLSLACFVSGAKVEPLPPVGRWFYGGPGCSILAVLGFAIAAILLVAPWIRKTHRTEARIAAAFTIGPLAALALLSAVTTPSYILGRTDAVAYPGFVLWAGIGFSTLPRSMKIAAASIFLFLTASATYSGLPIGDRERGNDRIVGVRLRQEVREGDWVAFVGLSRPSIDYYLSRGRPGRPDPSLHRIDYPASFGRNPAAVYPTPAESLRVWEEEAYEIRERIGEDLARGRFLYVVGPIHPLRGADPAASDLPYPGSILAYVMSGLDPLEAIARARGDGMGIDWLVYRVGGDDLPPPEDLQPIEAAP